MMRTFSLTTLGCKVNQYEGEQIAALLKQRGLLQVQRDGDLRIVHTCSVTVQAASKSRQIVRRQMGRSLHVLEPKVVVSGCWATSHPQEAAGLEGVSAVITNQEDTAKRLTRLVDGWLAAEHIPECVASARPGPWRVEIHADADGVAGATPSNGKVAVSLPQLQERQTGRQRALLKIQDGCDAHCTYCIIPKLRPVLWTKPVDEAVAEAQRLVQAGHQELVLTGIFLGAYGQQTARRRRQMRGEGRSLVTLVDALCQRVTGLKRLRLSSLEPGDLSPGLIETLRRHPQVVPHFHLPLQSGSDRILRRMNRQYDRDDFRQMVERVHRAFDRPALTTDVIVGFPGESDGEFERTMEICRQTGFIHIHAFSYSPRPGTAAARWTKEFVRGPVVNERIHVLTELAAEQSLLFRRSFLGQKVQVLVESPGEMDARSEHPWHGRSERYFPVHFQDESARPGMLVDLKVEQVSGSCTIGRPI